MNWLILLEQLMHERGWNQYDLADRSGYSQSNINRILKSKTPPSNKVLLRLAKAFELPVDYFQCSGPVANVQSVPVLSRDLLDSWLDDPACVESSIAEWVPVSQGNTPRLFAYALNSNDSQPGCPFGSVVIINPDLDVISGHKILCRLPDGRALVRQLQYAADSWFLAPLQPQLPMIEVGNVQSFTYLGTVISTVINEKLT